MRGLAVLAILATLVTAPVAAEQRPVPRPTMQEDITARGGTAAKLAQGAAITRSVRPVARRTMEDTLAPQVAAALRDPAPRIDPAGTLRQSARPVWRPDGMALASARTTRPTSIGGLCGRSGIEGRAIAPIAGTGGCGVANPVRITRVAGVELVQPARLTCEAARALDDWVQQGLKPAVGNAGGGAVALRVAAGYACRTRNSQSGAKISEHAKGNAIDISAIKLANGDTISVLDDWGRGSKGRVLRTLWQRACGPFGTVLGPESDRFHRDHFHFDVAAYRSGPYCR